MFASVPLFCSLFAVAAGPPHDLASRHLWAGHGDTWQSEGAVSALDVGAKGDGHADDWAALQAAVDKHRVVFLPKGFYRLSKPLLLRHAARPRPRPRPRPEPLRRTRRSWPIRLRFGFQVAILVRDVTKACGIDTCVGSHYSRIAT